MLILLREKLPTQSRSTALPMQTETLFPSLIRLDRVRLILSGMQLQKAKKILKTGWEAAKEIASAIYHNTDEAAEAIKNGNFIDWGNK